MSKMQKVKDSQKTHKVPEEDHLPDPLPDPLPDLYIDCDIHSVRG